MSQLSGGHKTTSPPPSSDTSSSDLSCPEINPLSTTAGRDSRHGQPDLRRPLTPPSDSDYAIAVNSPHRNSLLRRPPSGSRPLSMRLSHQPPVMDINENVIPELLPIFTFLNSQSNRLYHEGYFLKLDDQNTQGKPNLNRAWTECFAQLVGTVLSYWDAEELDAAGEDGQVLPKFINLTDASIKMIEALPTRSPEEVPLQNVLSISTAGRNRYLFHFNSRDSLLEWTAAVRLAMFEHSALQEAYTGALIAGKGKLLNNINIIMERSRFKTEVWARVRFGAGVPWRRCWCVICPPDEKQYTKMQKEMKRRSAYDRSPGPVLKGSIQFYDAKADGKKLKKAKPIASITDAYSAYAVYPQSKSLVDASTLIKIEGDISIHTAPQSSSEGFVFVMPEARPAISGFETMMSFLFPTWDTFGLYGRPGKLVASVLDSRSLMFAMPKHRDYGYLQLADVTGLLQSDGKTNHQEKEWRLRLKKATGHRMSSGEEGMQARSHGRSESATSLGPTVALGPRVSFLGDGDQSRHHRSSSESAHRPDRSFAVPSYGHRSQLSTSNHARGASVSSEDGHASTPRPVEAMMPSHSPEPVSRPPAFAHSPQDHPLSKPYHSPELRQINNRLSSNTLSQMVKAGGLKQPSKLGLHASTVDEGFSGPAVPRHASPANQYYDENRSPPPPVHSDMRPSSHHSYSSYRASSSHSKEASESGSNYSDEESRGPQFSAGFQVQSIPSPSPRPLPTLPPLDRYDQHEPEPFHDAGTFPGQFDSPYFARRNPDPVMSTSDSRRGEKYGEGPGAAMDSRPPPPPQHQQLRETSPRPPTFPNRDWDLDRPRSGILKYTGGPSSSLGDLGIPAVDFGPTWDLGKSVYGNQPRSPRRSPRPKSKGNERPSPQGPVAWRPPSYVDAQPSQGRQKSAQLAQRSHPNLHF